MFALRRALSPEREAEPAPEADTEAAGTQEEGDTFFGRLARSAGGLLRESNPSEEPAAPTTAPVATAPSPEPAADTTLGWVAEWLAGGAQAAQDDGVHISADCGSDGGRAGADADGGRASLGFRFWSAARALPPDTVPDTGVAADAGTASNYISRLGQVFESSPSDPGCGDTVAAGAAGEAGRGDDPNDSAMTLVDRLFGKKVQWGE